MKRWTILCIFCLAYQTAVGQLRGAYTLNYRCFGGKKIQFLKDNKFQYDYAMCAQIGRGKGTYTFRKNELVLTFEQDSTKKSYFRTTTTPLKNNVTKLHITALDGETKDTLLGAIITLKDKNGQIYQKQTLGLEGFVEINLPASAETFYVEFNAMGCEPLSYPIIPKRDYQIEAVLFWDIAEKIEAGKQMSFDIKVHKRYIELKEKGYPNASFERFDKRKE